MARGMCIRWDGLDGTGNSMQCRLLGDWLRAQGWEVTSCVDPGGTAVGGVVRELLLHHRGEMSMACETLLFMASRAQLTAEIIRPALEPGRPVIPHRLTLS